LSDSGGFAVQPVIAHIGICIGDVDELAFPKQQGSGGRAFRIVKNTTRHVEFRTCGLKYATLRAQRDFAAGAVAFCVVATGIGCRRAPKVGQRRPNPGRAIGKRPRLPYVNRYRLAPQCAIPLHRAVL
jgi:hypothetical protein